MRSFTFNCALALLFLRFSFLPETIAYFTGRNTYLLYVFGTLALIGVVAFGGLRRTFRYAPAQYWLAFLVYMVLAVPFSSWRGDSFMLVQTYIRTGFVMLLITAGLAMTWMECRQMLYAIALATLVNLATMQLLMTQTTNNDRIFMESKGMISDPNDLAAHLLLVLPFLLFFLLRRRTAVVTRYFLGIAIAFGILLIFRTGSRGGLVALIVTLAFVLIFGSIRKKIAVGLAAFLMCFLLVAVLPGSTWKRLRSFSGGDEVGQSSEARKYLLIKSIEISLRNPIFGVGPGQFMNYEGMQAVREGQHGYWHATHNTYTQISSECGIPALLFFLGAIISTFGMLQKIRTKAKKSRNYEIVTAAFCITLGLIAYSVASVFLANGYRFNFLAISGLVIAIERIASKIQPHPPSDNAPPEQPQTEDIGLNLLSS